MDILAVVLWPLVYFMELVLNLYHQITNSVGISIVLLSFTFAFFLLPLRKYTKQLEGRVSTKMKAAATEVAVAKQTKKGEALFLETEKIYKRHNYHPIQSVAMGAGFLIMLPVLLAAIILLNDSALLNGRSFLFIDDLSKPDHILDPVNLLPIIMSSITIIDAQFQFRDDFGAKLRFYILALILFILVHGLASGLVLYWTGSNLFSLAAGLIIGRKASADADPIH